MTPDVTTVAGAMAYILSVPAVIAFVAALAATGKLPGEYRRITAIGVGTALGAIATFIGSNYKWEAIGAGVIIGCGLGLLASLTVDVVKAQRPG